MTAQAASLYRAIVGEPQAAAAGSIAAETTAGAEIFALAAEIFPICRSITGAGVRETLERLARRIPIERRDVPTGTRVLDWTIPREWVISDAYIKNEHGERVVDFRRSNLHVLNYSAPVRALMPLSELKSHIYTLPDQPSLIPYRTSYYDERWGFCMAHEDLSRLPEGLYEAVIDSSLEDGVLSYGECLLPGETEDEVLLSAHICHPSLANDNCSGLALLTILAARLAQRRTHYSYRFLFAPGTIGAIAWLADHRDTVHRIKHGLVVAGVGDGGGPTYKKSRRGTAVIDKIMEKVLQDDAPAGSVIEFSPYGYDERQFGSPGFDLPMGLFQRSPFGQFPEYHTSADNLDFIRPEHLGLSFNIVSEAIRRLESESRPRSAAPFGEPQLGARGLYHSVGGDKDAPQKNMALLWVLNLADGENSLADMAERANMPLERIAQAAETLRRKGLILG